MIRKDILKESLVVEYLANYFKNIHYNVAFILPVL